LGTARVVYRDFSGRESRDSCLFYISDTESVQATANSRCTTAHLSAHLPTIASGDNSYIADNTPMTPGNIQSQIMKLVSTSVDDRTNVWVGATQPSSATTNDW
jgi:hypothetical protein